MAEDDWANAKRLLCVRLDNMGDVLMCTPALRALRRARPGRRLTLLTSAAGAAAAHFIPWLDDVIVHAASWVKAGAPSADNADSNAATTATATTTTTTTTTTTATTTAAAAAAAAAVADGELALVQALRDRAFDGAVIFNSYSQSALPAALLCHLAQIPLRLAHCRENPYQLLSHWVPESEPQLTVRHEVRRQLDLVASIGCRAGSTGLSFALRARDLAWMRRRLQQAAIGSVRPWVLLHPGASASSRRYPARHWAAVATALHAELGVDLVLSGGAAEADLVDAIVSMAAVPPPAMLSLAGALDPSTHRGRYPAGCCFTTCLAAIATRACVRKATTIASKRSSRPRWWQPCATYWKMPASCAPSRHDCAGRAHENAVTRTALKDFRSLSNGAGSLTPGFAPVHASARSRASVPSRRRPVP